jgi:CD163 antigen
MKFVQSSTPSYVLVPEGITGEDYMSLVDGANHCEGRLYLQYRNQQGFVCGDHLDLQEASVICRQLDCGPALAAPQFVLRPEEMVSPWLYDAQCQGEEATLWDCSLGSWGPISDCECQCVMAIICSGG